MNFKVMAIFGVMIASPALAAEWDAFVIRGTPTITELGSGVGATWSITETIQKVGYGTSAFDGQSLSSIASVTWDVTNGGTPTGTSAYLNFWVTDGSHYAVIAPGLGSLSDFQSTQVKIYETDFTQLSWLAPGKTVTRDGNSYLLIDGEIATVAQIGQLVIDDPDTYSGFVGSGAPKHGTGTNILYGASITSGYTIDNVAITAVPEISSLALMGLGVVGMMRRQR